MKVVNRREINTKKWDACIKRSETPLIYGLSWFLDASTDKQWEGLIWGDYDAVLPLPYKKYSGFKRIYIPNTIKFLDLFGDVHTQQIEDAKEFFKNKHTIIFSSQNIHFNQGKERVLCLLDLNKPYEELFSNYRKDRKRDVRKRADNLQIESISAQEHIHLLDTFWSKLFKRSRSDSSTFLRVLEALPSQIQSLQLKATVNGSTLGIVSCLVYHGRLYLQTLASNNLGYKHGVPTIFIDQLIQRYSGQPILFDFMGSSVPGIRAFNNSFGGYEETFQLMNKEHPLFSFLKKIKP